MAAGTSLEQRVLRPDGRFAPSPTGALHLGNLRTALLAWLFARSQAARFLVRIEDIDPDRLVPGMAEQQLGDLAALGIDWDEPPQRQTDRTALYDEALAQLAADDLVYPCFCTRAEVRAAASAPHGPLPEGAYPGTCATLGTSDARRRAAAGEASCLRVRADAARVAFDDRLLGHQQGTVDDFVVVRKDGVAAYNLVVVVDDAEQGVGEVVRGADLAGSTPRQLWLCGALGLHAPRHAHVPLVLGPDGRRLAKRHGGVTMIEWLDAGRTAADLRATLAATVGLLRGADERPTASELVDRFQPEALPSEPTVLAGDPFALVS